MSEVVSEGARETEDDGCKRKGGHYVIEKNKTYSKAIISAFPDLHLNKSRFGMFSRGSLGVKERGSEGVRRE